MHSISFKPTLEIGQRSPEEREHNNLFMWMLFKVIAYCL
jgi:hypothetical protein